MSWGGIYKIKTEIFFVEEDVRKYLPGGHHPVALGDTFKNDRYKIYHKLGYGGSSTVWVARDRELEQWVTLKIMTARETNKSRELHNLRKLENWSGDGSDYIIKLLDDFLHEGPNGIHQCLVLQLLGPSLYSIISSIPDESTLDPTHVLTISMTLIQAIQFLHEAGCAHGDLNTRNIVYSSDSLSRLSEDDLIELLGRPESEDVVRLDGMPLEKGIPKQLVRSARWDGWSYDEDNDTQVRLVDLGEAFFQDAIPEHLSQPGDLQVPETIFTDKFDHRVDLWRLGIMMYYLTFRSLPFDWFGERFDFAEQLIAFAGGLPTEWKPKLEQLRLENGDYNPGENEKEKERPSEKSKLEQVDVKALHPYLGPVISVIKGLARLSPSDRISVQEAMDILRAGIDSLIEMGYT